MNTTKHFLEIYLSFVDPMQHLGIVLVCITVEVEMKKQMKQKKDELQALTSPAGERTNTQKIVSRQTPLSLNVSLIFDQFDCVG